MATVLDDGSVIPGFLGVSDRARYSPVSGAMTMNDTSLRLGEVMAIYAPTDPLNRYGKENEYIVIAKYRNGSGSVDSASYRCVIADGFGSQGDRLRHSLRARDADQNKKNIGDGSWVLIACVNGDKAQAVIIGCLRNTNRTDQDPAGRFLDFEFNGVHFNVNDAGTLSLSVQGPTKTDGTAEDDSSKTTTITIDKTARVTVQTGDITVNANSATVNATDVSVAATTVEVDADHVNVKSDDINLGSDTLTPLDGVVTGTGIDTFTGSPYFVLGSASSTVKAKG